MSLTRSSTNGIPDRDWETCFPVTIGNGKARFPAEYQEVILERGGKRHRADVQIQGELVVEFQNSPISMAEVKAREAFYGSRMAWVFNCSSAWEDDRLTIYDRERFHSFLWKHPKRTPQRCHRPVFLDLGLGQILDVRRIYGDNRTTGWGYLRTYEEFVEGMTLRDPRGWMNLLYRGVERGLEWLDQSEDASVGA